jgi:hypothetical protein
MTVSMGKRARQEVSDRINSKWFWHEVMRYHYPIIHFSNIKSKIMDRFNYHLPPPTYVTCVTPSPVSCSVTTLIRFKPIYDWCLLTIIDYLHETIYHLPPVWRDSVKINVLDAKLELITVIYSWPKGFYFCSPSTIRIKIGFKMMCITSLKALFILKAKRRRAPLNLSHCGRQRALACAKMLITHLIAVTWVDGQAI